MRWTVIAPFIQSSEDRWLHNFAWREGRDFNVVPATYQHDRSRSSSGTAEWLDYFRHARTGWLSTQGSSESQKGGLITAFPQLALMAALHKRVRRRDVPIVAWCFNLGALYSGAKGRAARFAAPAVDTFVVHSTAEIDAYAGWLGLPRSRFEFVPLQRPLEPIQHAEEVEHPFLLAMGSAKRDYRTLVKAVERLGIETVIVAGEHAVSGIDLPRNVTVKRGLTSHECNVLTQRARVCVVPVANDQTASGQVTVIDSLMYGRATVATRCVGTVDYVDDGRTGILVDPGSEEQLVQALASLWGDVDARRRIGNSARDYVRDRLSDHAAGTALDQVLSRYEQ